jgi:hypothetical protein
LTNILDFPSLVFVTSLAALSLSARIGILVADKLRPVKEDEREDIQLLSSASLTLLALIIGFSFSMAVSRYDQRKNYEEEEANAIGTEYVRTDLLPAADAANIRSLLLRYLDQRVLFYTAHDSARLNVIDSETAKLQNQLWSAVEAVARTQPTPTIALAVAGMNDVLNSQGYTQAAWWNRIPLGAWRLMGGLAICCSMLIGYNAHERSGLLYMILPFLLSIAFLFIADIDSGRHGAIRVVPQNLISLSHSLHGR